MESVPRAVEIHAPLTAFRRRGVRVFLDSELALEGVEKFLFGQPVEIADDAVVSEYLHLRIGKDDGEKVVVVFLAAVCEALVAQLRAGAARARGAMMTVGDVKQRHRGETVDERVSISQPPDCVTDSIFRG